jgi:cystathionine beta-lyase/cystathionine gamma-synthase
MYGGTYRLFSKVFEKFGIRFHYINMQDPGQITNHINPHTKLIWLETPTNPLMNVIDIETVSAIASRNKILLCVDNTFASPYLQNPLDMGADIVMHSATKYLGGHSDLIHGCLVMNDKALREQLYFIQKSCGAVPGPQDCFLVLRGLKTLDVRMQGIVEMVSGLRISIQPSNDQESLLVRIRRSSRICCCQKTNARIWRDDEF